MTHQAPIVAGEPFAAAPVVPSAHPANPYAPDRWCKARMADFLRALAGTHNVAEAARVVGMSRQSAYRLRARLKGQPFDIAWETAFQHSYDALHQAALERALHGVEVPVFHKGEQVGTYRRYDERLTCFLLARRNSLGAQVLGRYTAAAEFWSERWDRLLEQVEHGPAVWPQADGTPHDADSLEMLDENAASALAQRHSPDPLPSGRGV
ncbi:hypothetical protein [Novosphingobium sp. JCM 18896]|uniref:hypothetical protein n=1 Tax=Novosphingobium sp. JCM 18896 TaxID=2989731 RepID=UPI002222F23F|nr:hypothetical protein [Novosphingobium sp. JCM 18896]MCW1430337.1 hypothetical protein [Novosphingobium sp. JCM 18896]